MRKTLLAAQQMADAMVSDAEKKRAELVGEAEHNAQARVDELKQAVAAEEFRLKQAQESTAAYVRKLAQAHEEELAFLSNLGKLVPPEAAAAVKNDPSAEIKAALDAKAREEEQAQAQAQAQAQQAAAQPAAPRLVAVGPDDDIPPMPPELAAQGQDEFELDPDATRRDTDLKFGKDYQIQ